MLSKNELKQLITDFFIIHLGHFNSLNFLIFIGGNSIIFEIGGGCGKSLKMSPWENVTFCRPK